LGVQFSAPRTAPHDRLRSDRRRRAILRSYLSAIDEGVDWTSGRYRDLEARFVRIAADYAAEHGISAKAWLLFGVPTRVVTAAGIPMDPITEHEARA
jgi:hypothetical protein